MKLDLLPRYVQILIFLTSIFLLVDDVFGATPSKPAMSDAAVLAIYKECAGERSSPGCEYANVEDRTINASAINAVVGWAQDEIIAGRESLPPLKVGNCVINGSIEFQNLKQTPFEQLPDWIQEVLAGSKTQQLAVIPVELEFSRTTFKAAGFTGALFLRRLTLHTCVFESTIHEDEAMFANSVFQESANFAWTQFNGTANFENATFLRRADFPLTEFKGDARFVNTTFRGIAAFTNSQFHDSAIFAGSSFLNATFFFGTKFEKTISFNKARVEGDVSFYQVEFPSFAYFNDINADPSSKVDGALIFRNVAFHERAYFVNTRLRSAWFTPSPAGAGMPLQTSIAWNPFMPVVFDKSASFKGLVCNQASFTDVEFHDLVDFGNARFTESISFQGSRFEKDVSFYDAEFPIALGSSKVKSESGDAPAKEIPNGLNLNDVRFQKPVSFEWGQLRGRVIASDKSTWELLETSFKQTGNLEGQNEAMYQRRQLERSLSQGRKRFGDLIEFGFWGYGVRPLRVAFWILAFCLFFTGLYWLRPRAITLDRSKWWGPWDRVKVAVEFSARTSWKLLYGYENARTPTFRVLALVQSIGFKVLAFFLLKAFSNTSPLLNELVGKLVRL